MKNTMDYFATTENENSFKTLTNTLAYFAKVPVGKTKKSFKTLTNTLGLL
jgi:hypothetical protein